MAVAVNGIAADSRRRYNPINPTALAASTFGLRARAAGQQKGVSNDMVRKAILSALLFAVILLSAGCRTVEGVGRDITWLGEKGAEVFE